MKSILPPLIILIAQALAWQCPDCGAENDGTFCQVCHLPETPEGMVFVPAATVVLDGEEIDVPRFFIDIEPATYRDFLPWLNTAGFTVENLGVVITGVSGDAMEFLAFTPFMGDQTGGITVPSQCLENPAGSITWNGAQSFLSEQGKRLPTLAEMQAAADNGVIQPLDSYQIMLTFSDHMRATMGDMLGTLGTQAMFAGYSTVNERVMWEFTGSVSGGDPTSTAPPPEAEYVNIFKPLQEPLVSTINRENGYFNVIFRGAIQVP